MKERKAAVSGDVNIELLGKYSMAYKSIFESCGFTNAIWYATPTDDRCSPCIGHILCNLDTSQRLSAVFKPDIADHHPRSLLTPSEHG